METSFLEWLVQLQHTAPKSWESQSSKGLVHFFSAFHLCGPSK